MTDAVTVDKAGRNGHSSGNSFRERNNRAQFVVDQLNTTLVPGWSCNMFSFSPIGQEFVPDLDASDVVEISVSDASCSLSGSTGGNFEVEIRNATIDGNIIATSDIYHFDNCFFDIPRITFPAFVPLVPGHTYVFQPVYVSDNCGTLELDLGPNPTAA
jgi:hypothetical protein